MFLFVSVGKTVSSEKHITEGNTEIIDQQNYINIIIIYYFIQIDRIFVLKWL